MTSPAFNLPFRARVLHRREETVVVLLSIGSTDIGTISFEAAAGRPPRSLVEEAIAEMFLGNLVVEPVEKTVEPASQPEEPTGAAGDEDPDENPADSEQADTPAESDDSADA